MTLVHMAACGKASLEIFQWLKEIGADLSAKDKVSEGGDKSKVIGYGINRV